MGIIDDMIEKCQNTQLLESTIDFTKFKDQKLETRWISSKVITHIEDKGELAI
jgi:hypothetical protein